MKAKNLNQLQDREMIDLLEMYLGDQAWRFKWKDKKFVEALIGMPNDKKNKDFSTTKMPVRLRLINYPSINASIVGEIHLSSYTGSAVCFAIVSLSDPNGPNFINGKVKTAVKMFNTISCEQTAAQLLLDDDEE
jgi:hypothetical protein